MVEFFFTLIGFIFLMVGANFLIDGVASLAKKLKTSEMIIGLTVIAFGTSMPELAVNIFASTGNNSGIVIGNIIGSNMFNLLFILGICSLIFPLELKKNTIYKEIPFMVFSVLVFFLLANNFFFTDLTSRSISRVDGILLIILFFVFLFFIFFISKPQTNNDPKVKDRGLFITLILMISGFIMIYYGSSITLKNALLIMERTETSESLIGLTLIAWGTSFPELIVSVIAALRKKPDIAIGNIIGSNIFNLVFIIGISSLIRPIEFVHILNFDIYMLFVAAGFVYVFMFTGKKKIIDRWEAVLMIMLFIYYTAYIIKRG